MLDIFLTELKLLTANPIILLPAIPKIPIKTIPLKIDNTNLNLISNGPNLNSKPLFLFPLK